MKTMILAMMAICFSSIAMADVVFKQPAAINNCNTAMEKQQLRAYLNGKSGATMPSCYKAVGVPATYPAVDNCKTALQKQAKRLYLNGKSGYSNPPSCYTPARWVGRAKSWATCSNAEKRQVRRAQNRGDVNYPACYQ